MKDFFFTKEKNKLIDNSILKKSKDFLVNENKFLNNLIDTSENNDNIELENNKLKRKYNTDFRKKLINKLEYIKDKTFLLKIYNIIINDIGNNFSSNINGIFINMNIISNNCIDNLINLLDEINKINVLLNNNDSTNLNIYKLDDAEVLSELGHKLSNQEKNIIKRIKK
jgi:hypothetical protein